MPADRTGIKNSIFAPFATVMFFALFNVALLLIPNEYPFTDLPNHLAEATVYRCSGDSRASLTKSFKCEIPPWKPNIGHIFLYSVFPDVEIANLVCYALYLMLVPLGVAWLIRLCQGDLWLSILSCLTYYNFNTCWGFVGFTLAIPLVLLYLATHIVYLDRKCRSTGVILAFVIVASFWMHVLAFLFVMLCFLCIELVDMRFSGKPYAWTRLWPILPGVILFMGWPLLDTGNAWAAGGELHFFTTYYSHQYLASIGNRLVNAFFYSNHVWLQYGMYKLLGSLFTLAIVVPVLWFRARRGRESGEPEAPIRARRAVMCFTFAAAICYMVLPDKLPLQHFLYERFLVFALLGLVCMASWITDERFRRLLRVFAVCIVAIYSLLWGVYVQGFKNWTADFEDFVRTAQDTQADRSAAFIIGEPEFLAPPVLIALNDATLAGLRTVAHRLNLDGTTLFNRIFKMLGKPRGHPVLLHFNNYLIVRHGRITPTCMVDYRFGAVRRRSPRVNVSRYEEWILPRIDLGQLLRNYRNYDEIITHGTRAFNFLCSSPLFTLTKKSNGWALFTRVGGHDRDGIDHRGTSSHQ